MMHKLLLSQQLQRQEAIMGNLKQQIVTSSSTRMRSKATANTAIIPIERIEGRIYFFRGQKVMLDTDLAALYGVSASRLNEAVKRNLDRFPADFMFRLTPDESNALTSQAAISKRRGGRRTPPYAFTQEGVAMLSSVLRSGRAVAVNIQIMRAFVRLRQYLASHDELRRKLEDLERRLGEHDEQIAAVFEAIRQLMAEPEPPAKPPIGFHTEERR